MVYDKVNYSIVNNTTLFVSKLFSMFITHCVEMPIIWSYGQAFKTIALITGTATNYPQTKEKICYLMRSCYCLCYLRMVMKQSKLSFICAWSGTWSRRRPCRPTRPWSTLWMGCVMRVGQAPARGPDGRARGLLKRIGTGICWTSISTSHTCWTTVIILTCRWVQTGFRFYWLGSKGRRCFASHSFSHKTIFTRYFVKSPVFHYNY